MAGGGGEPCTPALQTGNALLQHRDGGIAQARVDVAEIVQVEQRGGVVHVVEHVGRGLKDRRDPGAGRGIGRGAGMHRERAEPVGLVACGRRMGLCAPLGRRFGRTVADDAGSDAAPGQFAAEPTEFDLWAAVHDDFDPRFLGALGGFVVADAELHPHHLGTDRDRVFHDRPHLVGGAKEIDHVDAVGNVAQRGISTLAQQFVAGDARVHRDHAIAFALQILHHEVAGPVPVGRGADQRNGAHGGQDAADLGVGIRNRLDGGHAALLQAPGWGGHIGSANRPTAGWQWPPMSRRNRARSRAARRFRFAAPVSAPRPSDAGWPGARQRDARRWLRCPAFERGNLRTGHHAIGI